MSEIKNLKDFLPSKDAGYYRKIDKNIELNQIIKNSDIIKCLKTVMDPEIPVNLYDLGLIYSIKNDKNHIKIEMTLTNPNCPVAGQMPESVGKSMEHLDGLKSIEVKIVWQPTWNKDMMSEEAKLALDIF